MPVYKYKNKDAKTRYLVRLCFHSVKHFKQGFKTKQEARDYELEWLKCFDSNISAKKTIKFKLAVKEYLKKFKLNCKLTSYDCKLRRVNYHLIPYFSDMNVNDIKLLDVQNFVELKQKDKRISMVYINRLLSDLRLILNYANDYLDCDNKIVNKIEKYKDYSIKKEVPYISIEDFKKFLDVIPKEQTEYKLLFKLAYLTGLRISEITSLRIKDIDFTNHIIKISHQTIYVAIEHKYIEQEPKTTNSNRIIYLSDDLFNEIKHYIDCRCLKDNHYLFYKRNRRSNIAHTSIRRAITKYCKLANIKQFTFHTLRKSFATNLISSNVNNSIVAKLMGHYSINTTNKYYLSLSDKEKTNIENLVDNIAKKI